MSHSAPWGSTPRVGCVVHAGQSDGIAIHIEPDADGVAVDHTVHLGGAGLREDWPAGQSREDREGDDVPPDATRP